MADDKAPKKKKKVEAKPGEERKKSDTAVKAGEDRKKSNAKPEGDAAAKKNAAGTLKVSADVTVDEPTTTDAATTKPKPKLKVSADVSVEEAPKTPEGGAQTPRPKLKVSADVSVDELEPTEGKEPRPKPKLAITADVSVEEGSREPDVAVQLPVPPRKKTLPSRDALLDDLDTDKLQELQEAFELFDLDHDGFIDKHDLKLTFVSLGRTDITDEELTSMLSEAPDPLDFEGFVMLLGYKTVELDPEVILMDALSRWDYDQSGLISEERIKHDLMTWGDKFTLTEVNQALEDAPTFWQKGQTMIDYVKFCRLLCGLRKKTKELVPEDFM